MSRTDFRGDRAQAASRPEPGGPGLLFNLGLTIAWLRIQLLSLLRPRAS